MREECNDREINRRDHKKYDISRQTLNSWLNQGILQRPKKDFRNRYVWTKEDEKNLQEVLSSKTYANNREEDGSASESNLKIANRRYLGSKNKLLSFICETVKDKLGEIEVVADIFAGTGVVANLFVDKGKRVIVNDILISNYVSYLTWFGSQEVDEKKIFDFIQELNGLEASSDNYVSEHFGDRYFSLENARKIGLIREHIERFGGNERERAFLLTSLLYAMDKVANTVGHYDAYRKKMEMYQPILLKMPEYRVNTGNESTAKMPLNW